MTLGRGIAMHIFAVAIGAFDPAGIVGDLQPDPRMAQRAVAAVAGDPVLFDELRFWRFECHCVAVLVVVAVRGMD